MIIFREVHYKMQPFSCQHREQNIYKQNYEISVLQEVNISRLELQKEGPSDLLFPYYSIYLGFDIEVLSSLAHFFLNHVIQILIRRMNIPSNEKLTSFAETFNAYNQIIIFEEQLYKSNMDFYI